MILSDLFMLAKTIPESHPLITIDKKVVLIYLRKKMPPFTGKHIIFLCNNKN